MSPTVAKFLERLLIVVVISALGFVADQANTLGPYGVAVGSVASMLLLVVGKFRPAPATPAVPVPSPAPAPAKPQPGSGMAPLMIVKGTPYAGPAPTMPNVTPAMAEACRVRGLELPTTSADWFAAHALAQKDAAASPELDSPDLKPLFPN